MSSTVTYKGNTLTTVDNATRKLNTKGKYLEDDITIVDVSGGSSAVTVTEETLPSGGIAKHITAVDISDTTAQAADVAQGKYFYTAQGVKTAGTASGGGGSTAEKKQVNFIDYDGTILYSYTAQEAQALTALPANPSHSGLIAQGWNWSLANIKSQLTNVGGDVWVGQMYETASGKTEIDINVDNPDFLSPYLAIAVNGTVTIDWGDGTATDTVTGTSYITLTFTPHVYATTGRYTISIDGPMGFYCHTTSYSALLTNTTSLSYRKTYSQYVEAIRCADGVRIGSSAFRYCFSLQSITIPEGVTDIGAGAFAYCYALQSVTIPDSITSISMNEFYNCSSVQLITIPNGVTSIGSSAFHNCYALQSITIPDGVTSIGSSTFNSCRSLQSISIPDGVTSIGSNTFYICDAFQLITIPDGVTSIGSNAFYNCYSVMEYHLLPTTPPTLAGTNVFTGIIAGTIIYVPQGSLEAYQTATNWSTYASYMQEETS